MPLAGETLLAATMAVAIALAVIAAYRATCTSSGLGPVGDGFAIAGLFAPLISVLLPGLLHQHGFDSLISFVGLAGGLFLSAVLIGPAMARAGTETIPQLAGSRFGRTAQAVVLIPALAATGGFLIAVLLIGSSLLSSMFLVPLTTAALGLAGAALLLALPHGLRSVLYASRALAMASILALILPLAAVCWTLLGNPVPQLAYGHVLQEIAPAELALIEAGQVDFGLFKPFLREFLSVDRLNWALMSVCLMAAIAALPHLGQAASTLAPSTARRSFAWALTVLVIALTAVPALASLARLETYRAVAAGGTYSDLPDWIQRGSEIDAIRLNGTSLHLIHAVTEDVASGSTSIDAISANMAMRGEKAEAIWQRLDPAVQEAVLELARKFKELPGLPPQDRWRAYVDTFVVAAASAAGRDPDRPDLASISIDPQMLVVALPHVSGMPLAVFSAVALITLIGLVVATAALLAALATLLVRDGSSTLLGMGRAYPGEGLLLRIAMVVLALTFALTATITRASPDVMLVVSLVVAAAGLLPALVLSLWCHRANAWGLVAATVTSLALAAYYLVGTSLYGVTFYETWAVLSSAGPEAFADFEEARDLWLAAQGDDRAAAYADLAARTTGSLWSPGIANWFGIAPAAAPVLSVPFGLLIGLIVSVATPRPSAQSLAVLDRIHARLLSTVSS